MIGGYLPDIGKDRGVPI